MTPRHFESFNAVNFKVVFPVFFTVIRYSTFFPASELNFAVVNANFPSNPLFLLDFEVVGSSTSTSTGGVSFSFSPPFTVAAFV